MKLKIRGWLKQLKRLGSSALIAALTIFWGESAFAQSKIIPDRTLGTENSQVRTNAVDGNPAEIIEGGAQRGANLFHSFEEFNIENGRGAYFNNPAAVENIFGRVTGSNPSEILGTLGVSGNADLFLINPNGIAFGENARLDINGSFYGSSANNILFEEGEFSAADPETPPLLTVNVPIGLGFGDAPGDIINRSTVQNTAAETVGLEVGTGQSLTLLGGNIDFDGGHITARGGNIKLGGLLEAGTIEIDENGSLDFPQNVNRSDITLGNAAEIDVRGDKGSIDIDAGNLTLQGGEPSLVRAGIGDDSTSSQAQAGDITIDVAKNIALDESSISNLVEANAVGNAGNVEVTANNLTLTNGGRISASTFGRGNAGNVDVTATGKISLDGENSIAEGSRISSVVNDLAVGNSDGLVIDTKNLTLTNGATIVTSTLGQGNAGDISIDATENITLDGVTSENLPSSIASLTSLGAVGDAGEIEISTSNLSLIDGGLVTAATFGRGDAGNVDVTATRNTVLDGTTSEITQIPSSISGLEDSLDPVLFQSFIPDNFTVPSSINSVVFVGAAGDAGDVNISTSNLSIANGGEVSASTFGLGNAGGVNIDANDITLDGENSLGKVSLISSTVQNRAIGDSAGITIKTDNLTLSGGAGISAGVEGQGDAGNIEINANKNIVFDGESSFGLPSGIGSLIGVDAVGNAGDIAIAASNLTLTNGAVVTTSTTGKGKAGNIEIDAEKVVLDGEKQLDARFPTGISSLSSIGAEGDAGGINITSSDLTLTNGGQITASALGQGNAGLVEIDVAENIVVDGTVSEPIDLLSSFEALTQNAPRVRSNPDRTISRAFRVPSSINSIVFPGAVGNAGGVNITTDNVSLTNGGQIAASTFGQGNAGGVNINAEDLIFINGEAESNRSGISANVLNFAGKGGDVDVVGERIVIEDGGSIEAINLDSSNALIPGTGQPGNINLEATSLALSGNSKIDAVTQAEIGTGGIIDLQVAEKITLRDRSFISAEASGNANGGNLSIDTGFVIAAPNQNNDIVASAEAGDGGDVNINADSLFGIEERPLDDATNDINASSEFGLSGTVAIDTSNINRDRDLVRLPEQPTEREIVRVCDRNQDSKENEFVIKGSGGLPPSLEDPLNSDAIEVDWIERQARSSSPKIPNPITQKFTAIVEAKGWVVNSKNEIVLVADERLKTQPWQKPQCPRSSVLDRQNNVLIASTKPQSIKTVPERIAIDNFELVGNKVFESSELTQVLARFTNKSLSFAELLQVRSAITKHYTKQGYITSGAYIPPQKLESGVLKIQIVEGYLENIEVKGNKKLSSDYFSSRLQTKGEALQQVDLLGSLQLLQQNPLIASISAELAAGTRPGANTLTLEVEEADSLETSTMLDNRRTPSVGSFRRQLALNEGNLLGFGDNLSLAYSNTDGSDAFDGSYAFPINSQDGTLTISGGLSSSEVVEEPFEQLEILGDSQYYELSLRQPLVQTPTQEFALGITASRRNSDISSLLEEFNISPAELSPGADESGETRVSALRFFQEWTKRNRKQVIAARSEFNLGLNAFDATVNKDAPDSRFLTWQGQAQWTRQLSADTSFLLRGGVQLAGTSLLSSERLGLGGASNLRGYRQDFLLADSAAFASAEIRLPLWRMNQIDGVLQVAPFFDLGTAWNNDREEEITNSTLASAGLGLRLLFSNLTARFDWGIPLVSVDSDKKTWQENGLHFSLEYNPF